MLETITFLLAPIGYAGLTLLAIKAAGGSIPAWLLRGVAAVIVAHVVLVWVVRYEGQFSEATRNGYVGFVLFHAALLALLASVFLPGRLAGPLIVATFGVATVGAVGAVFRYDTVTMYRIPVAVCAIAGCGAVIRAYRMKRGRNAPDGALSSRT